MTTAWPAYAAKADYAANKCVQTTRVQNLVDRDLVFIETPFSLYLPETITSNGSPYATAKTWQLYLPDYAAGKYLHGRIWVHGTGGTAAYWRLKIGATTSAGGSTTSTSYSFLAEQSLLLPSSPDSFVSVELQTYSGSPAVNSYYRCLGDLSFWFED